MATSTTPPARSRGRRASSSTSGAAPRASPPTSPPSCCSLARVRPTSAATCACTASRGAGAESGYRHVAEVIGCATTRSPPRGSTSGCGGTRSAAPRDHLLDPRAGRPARRPASSAPPRRPRPPARGSARQGGRARRPGREAAASCPLRRPAPTLPRRMLAPNAARMPTRADPAESAGADFSEARCRHEGSDGVRLVAREPRVRHRRARPHRAVGGDRARDGDDGRYVYAIGGRKLSSDKNLGTLERYDPVSDRWTTLESMPAAIGGVAAAYVVDGNHCRRRALRCFRCRLGV